MSECKEKKQKKDGQEVYRNRELIFAQFRGGKSPANDLTCKLLPHLTHISCTQEFAFNMSLVKDENFEVTQHG